MNPLGFYVSAPSDQFESERLAEMEEKYGSYFQNASLEELSFALARSVMDRELHYLSEEAAFVSKTQFGVLFDYLSPNTWFLMIPFLYEAIAERRGLSNRPERIVPPLVIEDGDHLIPHTQIAEVEFNSPSRRATIYMKPGSSESEYDCDGKDYDNLINWLSACGYSPSDWEQSALTL